MKVQIFVFTEYYRTEISWPGIEMLYKHQLGKDYRKSTSKSLGVERTLPSRQNQSVWLGQRELGGGKLWNPKFWNVKTQVVPCSQYLRILFSSSNGMIYLKSSVKWTCLLGQSGCSTELNTGECGRYNKETTAKSSGETWWDLKTGGRKLPYSAHGQI